MITFPTVSKHALSEDAVVRVELPLIPISHIIVVRTAACANNGVHRNSQPQRWMFDFAHGIRARTASQ
jgi:hypothetical protein